MKTIKNLKAEEIRKSILQLAIQGKLVKQNPNDEPASELVKKIYEEKKKLIAEGKIKKDKNESYIFKGDDNCYYEKFGKAEPIKLEDLPFDIPDNWAWIRFGNLVNISTGASFKKEQAIQEYKDNFTRVLRGGNILPFKYLLKNDDLYIPSDLVNQEILLRKNDLITPAVTSLENIGKVAVIDKNYENITAGGFVYIFRPNLNNLLTSTLIMDFMSSAAFQELMKSITKKSGQAFYNMNKERLKDLFFPVPPLEEQQRIVDKINSIEPMIQEYDKYEKQLSELESTFSEKLKKSILQYAIEGKLVKQDPNDEPASVLLERIKAEKEKLIKEGKIKRDKNESYIYQGDDKNYYENLLSFYHEFVTPSNWKCTDLINICQFIQRGKSPTYSDKKCVPVISQKCNQKNGEISLEKSLFISFDTFKKYNETKVLKPNDIIINSTGGGTVGRVGLISNTLYNDYEYLVPDSHITTIRLLPDINPSYVYYYLKSPFIYDHVEEKCEGSTNQIELYTKVIMSYPFPLPPIKEQNKIVNKINSILIYL